MKKTLLTIMVLMLILATTACGQESKTGFKTELPTFTEAHITTGGSEWTVQMESYEISGDKIYIHSTAECDILVSLDDCFLFSSNT